MQANEIRLDPNIKQFLDTLPGLWACKDINSVFLYANAKFSSLLGMKMPEDCVGRTDFEFPCENVECAHLFQKQDKKVIEIDNKIQILDVHPYAKKEWKIIITTKIPLRNEKNKIIGTIWNGIDITNQNMHEVARQLSRMTTHDRHNFIGQNSYTLNDIFYDINLTSRQSEVIFYIIRGKTVKHIAKILKISPRTVDEHLEQLRFKFNVQNKSELIDKAILNGYLNYIPPTLFREQLSVELDKS